MVQAEYVTGGQCAGWIVNSQAANDAAVVQL